MSKLEELKQEATDLGIVFSANIGETKLAEKIEAFYASQETSSKELEELVTKVEKEESTTVKNFRAFAAEAERKARKTSIVTIIDNDHRENNHTTAAVVSCSNAYFDLGTIVLPLNMEVEVMQGHIDALKECKIPMHIKDPKSGLTETVLRSRYNISYSDKAPG